jgi:type IV secretory pathway VirD2 relaxase
MSDEFDFPDFRAKPGRIAAGRGQRVTPILTRIGSGAAAVRRGGPSSARSRTSVPRAAYGGGRQVVVKARVHKLAGQGRQAAAAHLRYLVRDGTTRDGERGRFYDAGSDDADADAFRKRGEGDRHQFRFVVSPEDANEIADLKPYVRGLVADMERDLGTRLDWVAMDHHDTGHAHTHLVVRGRTDRDTNLVIPRAYISCGLREAAEERLTRQLGPPSRDRQLEKIAADIERVRQTPIDRVIERHTDPSGRIVPSTVPLQRGAALRSQHLTARLKRLEQLRLAERVGGGAWTVVPNLADRLRKLAIRQQAFERIEQAFRGAAYAPSPHDYVLFDPNVGDAVTGRVAASGMANEANGQHYAVLEATDGRAVHVMLGTADHTDVLRRGAVVTITPAVVRASETDRRIAEIARRNGGRYSAQLHNATDPKASEAFLRTHLRRLEAERRQGNAERGDGGVWTVPDDYVARVEEGLRARAARQPVKVRGETTLSLGAQTATRGATWLDRIVVGERPPPTRDAGFGAEVTTALGQRRAWLAREGYAQREAGRFVPNAKMLASLEADELREVGGRLSGEMGKPFRPVRYGDEVDGVYRQPVQLASGRYALIEGDREFALVPWRDVLERNRGKEVSGIMRGRTVSWTLRRDRGLER